MKDQPNEDWKPLTTYELLEAAGAEVDSFMESLK
jgi:hypothetical protein